MKFLSSLSRLRAYHFLVKICVAFCAGTLLASCGGGNSGGGVPINIPPPTMPINLAVSGVAVVKVQSGNLGVAVMEEKLTSLFESGPDRRITLLDNKGAISGRYLPPTGWAVIDFTQHPSGEISVVLATAKTVRLVRLDRFAAPINEFDVIDAQAATDPFYDDGNDGPRDDNAMLPLFTRDAVRLATVSEDVAVALRTGRHAVLAYRFSYQKIVGYTRIWRTLVEPGLSMSAKGLKSGGFDVFGQLENHWHVHLDSDAAGNLVVASTSKAFIAPLFVAHADYFKQPTNALFGVVLTQLGPDGRRLGSTLIDTVQTSELHGLRLSGDDIALVGRVFSEQRDDGSGWNAYVAHINRGSGSLLSYRTIDLDKGEVLFDIAPMAQGRFLVAGASGYTQNPTGGSISETTAPLLAVLESDGTLRQRIDVVAGARQNQLRSLAARGSNWLVSGMSNGPGTHSADGNPALITADGFVREVTVSIP